MREVGLKYRSPGIKHPGATGECCVAVLVPIALITVYLAETVSQASSTAPTGSWIPFFSPSGRHVHITDIRSAQANGFSQTDPEWANLGQGAPEVS